MRRLLQSLGVITLIYGLVYIAKYLRLNFSVVNDILQFLGLISILILLSYIIIRLIWGKNWLLKIGQTTLIGNDLIKATKLFLREIPSPSNETTANLIGHLVYRFTRIGIIGIFLTLIPVILLWQQNQKIEEQTKLFEIQNRKIDAQIELDESSRRGNLVVMMSNVLDKVDEELRRDSVSRKLSTQLIGRISALSQAFKPYRFWQDSSLTEKPLSPERGQLLIALVNSDLDSSTYDKIYKSSTFKDAYLERANLMNAYLKGVYLWEADLSKANLIGANLSSSNLVGANMKSVDLTSANLTGAHITNADLSHGLLYGAILRNSNLSESNFMNSKLNNADLGETHLRNADFQNANIESVILWKSYLDGLKVKDKNWLEKLRDWSVIGYRDIQNGYEIDSSSHSKTGYCKLLESK